MDLPSGEHASTFLAAPTVNNGVQLGVDVVGRAMLIALGMHWLGRKRRVDFRLALAGSVGIELFVLGYKAQQRAKLTR